MKSKFRDPVSGLTHLFAAIASFIGMIVLLVKGWGDPVKEATLIVYSLGLMLMFSASATYHSVISGPEVILRLRKLDHSAIYVMIAGTYTPLCLFFFEGFWRWGLLAIIWAIAVIGVTVKIFVIRAPRWLNAGIYLMMGWLCIMGVQEIGRTMPAGAIFWLVAGGVFFTVGALIYITKKMDFVPGVFGFHEVWHIFVILGCLAHYILIVTYIAPTPPMIGL